MFKAGGSGYTQKVERNLLCTDRQRSIPQGSKDGLEWRHKEEDGETGQEFGEKGEEIWSSSGV